MMANRIEDRENEAEIPVEGAITRWIVWTGALPSSFTREQRQFLCKFAQAVLRDADRIPQNSRSV